MENKIRKEVEEYEKNSKEEPDVGTGVKEPSPQSVRLNSLVNKKNN